MDKVLPSFYSNFMEKTPLLTKEEEIQLSNDVFGKSKIKRKKAIDKLVESNIRLAVKIATKDFAWFSEREDIISEGVIGLQKAAEKFDSNFGARFSTYCSYYIKQRIMHYIGKSSLVSMSSGMNNTYQRIQKIATNLADELGYEPSLEQIAEVVGMDTERIENILNYKFSYVPMDTPVFSEEDKTLSETIEDENAIMPDKVAEYNSDTGEIDEYLKGLKPRELFIIKKRFGFDGQEPMILKDVGKILNVTRERTRQLQNIAMKKIKKNLKDRNKQLKVLSC